MSAPSLAQPSRTVPEPEPRPTNRFERGVDLAVNSRIEALGEGTYKVWGSRPTPYLVDLHQGICSCPDWPHNHEQVGYCKHLHGIAIRLRRGLLKRHAPRTPVAHLHKLGPGESLRGVLTSPEALDALAEKLGV